MSEEQEYAIGDSIISEEEWGEYEVRIRTLAPGTEMVGFTVMPDGTMFCCFRYPLTGTHRGLDPIRHRGSEGAYEQEILSASYPHQYWGATPPSVGTDRTYVARSDDMGENWYIVQDLGFTSKATMDGVLIGYFAPAQLHRRKFRVVGKQDYNYSWGVPHDGDYTKATELDELVAVYPNPNDFMVGAELEEFLSYNHTMRGVKTLDPSEPTSPWEPFPTEYPTDPEDWTVLRPAPHQEEDGEWYYVVEKSHNMGRNLKGPWYKTNVYKVYDCEDQWITNEGMVFYDEPQVIYNYDDKGESVVVTSGSQSLTYGNNTLRSVSNLNRADADFGYLPGLIRPIKRPFVWTDDGGNIYYAGIGSRHEPGTLLLIDHVVFETQKVIRYDSNGKPYTSLETVWWTIPHWYHYASYQGIYNLGAPTGWGGTIPVRRPQGLFVKFDTFWTDGVRTGLRYYSNVLNSHFSWIHGGGFAPENTRTGFTGRINERSTFGIMETGTIKELDLEDDGKWLDKVTGIAYVDPLGNANIGVVGSRETKNYGRPGKHRVRSVQIFAPDSPANSVEPGKMALPMNKDGKYPLKLMAQSEGLTGFMEVFDPNVVDGFHKQGNDESIYNDSNDREPMQERPTLRKATYW